MVTEKTSSFPKETPCSPITAPPHIIKRSRDLFRGAPNSARLAHKGAGYGTVDEWAESAYDTIRLLNRADIDIVAKNAGLSVDEVLTLKKHLFFGKHKLPLDGGKGFFRSRFAAHDEIAYAWQKAQKGTLTAAEKKWFRQLVDHELGERALMTRGVPYRHPLSWDSEIGRWTSVPPGAHDLAPPHAPYGSFPGFSDWFLKNF